MRQRFKEAIAQKNFKPDDVEAGRELIEVYVPFIHYVERLYAAANNPVVGHFPESAEVVAH